MKCFDAGTKKMSDPPFGTFIKLVTWNVQCSSNWMYRDMGLAAAQNGVHTVVLATHSDHWY